MKSKGLFFVLLGVLIVSCCLYPLLSGGAPEKTVWDVEEEALPLSQEALYEMLFSPDTTVSFDLQMSRLELEKLQQDYDHYGSFGSKSPIYRMADLEVTLSQQDKSYTFRIPQVGVRMKGNTSRTAFYSKEEGIYNLIHLKLSFSETFDDQAVYGEDALEWSKERRQQRKERTFATLEKLDLRWNKCDDTSYIKELYAYRMYKDFGVLAPNATLTRLTWAGEQLGVYTLCEPVDEIFLQRNLPKAQQGGDLYKCGWSHTGATFSSISGYGIEDENAAAFYSYDLKTNKKTSDHQALKNLLTRMNRRDLTKEDFAQLVDVDRFLGFAAVSYFLGNPDDLRNNYNNCYIYFLPDTGKMVLIPCDVDRCLGVTREWNPTGNGVTADDPFALTMAATGNPQGSPLFLYSVCRGGYYTEEFAQKLQQLAQSKWVQPEHFLAVFDTFRSRYADFTKPGKTFYNAAHHRFTFDAELTSDFASQDNISFREYTGAKLTVLWESLSAFQKEEAAPQLPTDFYIRADFTGWETDELYDLHMEADGCWWITLHQNDTFRFKVYSALTDRWYGSEVLTTDSLPSTTDGHTNIILPKGSYRIRFDPEAFTVTVLPVHTS